MSKSFLKRHCYPHLYGTWSRIVLKTRYFESVFKRMRFIYYSIVALHERSHLIEKYADTNKNVSVKTEPRCERKTLWKLNFSETMTHDNDWSFNACVYIKHKSKIMRFQCRFQISQLQSGGPQRLKKNKFLQLVPTCWWLICDQWKLNALNTSSWNDFGPSATVVAFKFLDAFKYPGLGAMSSNK